MTLEQFVAAWDIAMIAVVVVGFVCMFIGRKQ